MTTTKIPAEFLEAITGSEITDGGIGTADIADLGITTAKIANNAITAAKLPDNVITATHIPDGLITGTHIAGTTITATQIADNSIGTDQLAGIARGKIIYGDSNGDPQLLTLGSNGTVLKSDGTDISWGTISSYADSDVESYLDSNGTTFPDSVKAQFGAGSDLQIYHSGTNSVIDNNTGGLYIRNNVASDVGGDIFIQAKSGENSATFTHDGAVTLMHDNVTKFATTSSGIQVTGDIANTSGNFTLDVAGDIILDADDKQIFFKDNGTTVGTLSMTDSNLKFISNVNDKDMIFAGTDNNSEITALTLDMSAAGAAVFNSDVGIGATPNTYSGYTTLTLGSSSNGGIIDFERNGTIKGEIFTEAAIFGFQTIQANDDIIFKGNDGGSTITALTLDMSAAGVATFNSNIIAGGTIQADGNISTASDSGALRTGAGHDLKITYDGTNGEIDVNSGDLTLDVAGDIILDADGGDIKLRNGGTGIVTLEMTSGSDFSINQKENNKDIIFKGIDNSSEITALTLDMSEKGRATFNEYVVLGETNDARIYFNASSGYSPRLQSSTNALSIYTNDIERVNIDNDGNVRIGVDTGDAFNTTSPLRIGQTTNAYINIKAGTSHNGGILVGDSDDDFMGGFIYSNSTNALSLYANNAVKFTLGPGEGVAGFGAGSGNFAGSMLISNDGGTGTINNAYYNTGFGWEVFDDLTTGDSNTVMGNQAGYKLTEATGCTLIGRLAGTNIQTGSYNTAIGYNAIAGTSTNAGQKHTAVGYGALQNQTGGEENTAVGYLAGYNITTASGSVAMGQEALKTLQTGNFNVAIGRETLFNTNGGANNVAVGKEAGTACTTGDNNVFIGKSAGYDATDAEKNVFVGANTRNDNAGTSSQVVLGFEARSQGGGKFTVGTSSSTYSYISIGSSGGFTGSSDVRLKKEITDSTAGLSFINDLRPITFKWKTKGEVDVSLSHYEEGSTKPAIGESDSNVLTKHGFIAQEVKAAIDNHTEVKDGSEIWEESRDGIQNFCPTALIPMLVKSIQELDTKLTAAEARIKTLEDA